MKACPRQFGVWEYCKPASGFEAEPMWRYEGKATGSLVYLSLENHFRLKSSSFLPYHAPICLKSYDKVMQVVKLYFTITSLMPKEKYDLHYRNLQYYLSEGLILKRVHRILEFKQSTWMKPYIDFNTQKRKEATNEADSNLFKQFNNAVYGKTMENMRKRIKIRITTNEKDFIKYSSRPTCISHVKFGKNLVVIHEKKELLTLNKPIYVGCTVLELSKLEMYKYHYGFMKENVENF